jgi:hypothetical protein
MNPGAAETYNRPDVRRQQIVVHGGGALGLPGHGAHRRRAAGARMVLGWPKRILEVGPRIPAGEYTIQRPKAVKVGPISGPTWRLAHLERSFAVSVGAAAFAVSSP